MTTERISRLKFVQETLAQKLVINGRPDQISLVAGVDLAFSGETALCTVVLIEYPSLEVVEIVTNIDQVRMPYIPGYLTFREGPVALKTIRKLKKVPDIIVFDGQGIAHPRKMGVAAHLGLILGIPSIGCAKSRLFGTFQQPGNQKGEWSYLYGKEGEKIGTVLRTRTGVKPVFISPGHLVGIEEANAIMLRMTGKYRIPIPTRLAHMEAAKAKRDQLEKNKLLK